MFSKKYLLKKIDTNFRLTKILNIILIGIRELIKKKLEGVDILISDNLPEAIFLNKRVIIYANFFGMKFLIKIKVIYKS